MADIWTMDGVEDYYNGGREPMRGWEAFCFTLSHLVLRISLAVVAVVWCLLVCVCLCFVVLFFLASRETSASNSISIPLEFPVVDRPCLVLARQCRKKKKDTRGTGEEPLSDGLWNVQPESLSPDRAILGDVIRQGEEVRVREKCCGFVLIVEGTGVTYRPF